MSKPYKLENWFKDRLRQTIWRSAASLTKKGCWASRTNTPINILRFAVG
jgi:hypothetical protein